MEEVLPKWFRVLGWCAMPGAWILALRLLWEATVLTAREGGQMVGFALGHNSRAIVPLALSVLFMFAWVPSAIAWLGVLAFKGERPCRSEWIEIALAALALLILYFVPSNT